MERLQLQLGFTSLPWLPGETQSVRISRESRSPQVSPLQLKMSVSSRWCLHLTILVLQALHSHQLAFPRLGSSSSSSSDHLVRRSAPGSQVRFLAPLSPHTSLGFLISNNCITQVELQLQQCQVYSFDFTFQPSHHGGESSPGYRHGNITGDLDGNQIDLEILMTGLYIKHNDVSFRESFKIFHNF